MYRKHIELLYKWMQSRPRKPLVIRGARQVGKSTLVRKFAERIGIPLFEINLERYPHLDRDFKSLDITQIINALESIPKAPKIHDGMLIFLDEIQAAPHALAALRYFYEDLPKQPVISAGSLLEFVLSDHEFPIPVGRIEYLHLGPLSFDEYLGALGENQIQEKLGSFPLDPSVPERVHGRAVELFRQFCFVGGMPEAVARFAVSRKLGEARDVHVSILDTFRDDFVKYARKEDLSRLHLVFEYAARSVGKKVKYVNFSREEQSRTVKNIIDLLALARVVTKIFHSHAAGIPLTADVDLKVFKLLFLDVGLMNAVCGMEWPSLATMDSIRFVNSGSMAEQIVGQELMSSQRIQGKPELTYWIRERREGNAEVDFLTSVSGKIIPIEVKAGKSGTLKSLHEFARSHSIECALRLDLNTPSRQRINLGFAPSGRKPNSFTLYSLPLYLASNAVRFLAERGKNSMKYGPAAF